MTDATNGNLLTRSDTLLGICQGISDDTGINATLLRVVIAMLVLWSPVQALALYLLLGIVLATTRWLLPASPNS